MSDRAITLADIAAPHPGLFTNMSLVVGASLVTGIAAQIAVPLPWTPVPLMDRTINRFERVGPTLITAGTRGVLRYDPVK